MTLPLEPWFDMDKPIAKSDADLTQAPTVLYALKGGIGPECAGVKR